MNFAGSNNQPRLVIAAICSRPYVQAAVLAGYEVIAIDCFADVDTKRLAKSLHLIAMEDGQLAHDALIRLLAELKQLAPSSLVGFCYGAGVEMQTHVINEVAQYFPILGNAAQVVEESKSARYFYSLCDNFAIPYPKVMFTSPDNTHGWLQKTIGASGGAHIEMLTPDTQTSEQAVYFQQYQMGQPVSCLFLADAAQVQIIGFNAQWLDDNETQPFRYGGAASNLELSEPAKARLTHYVQQLAVKLGLRGLNSCDAICDGDDIYVLEINPRLSASIDLYLEEPALMKWHVEACQHRVTNAKLSYGMTQTSRAHQVIYAKQAVQVTVNQQWPVWATDIPEAESQIDVGMPICTVNAVAESTIMAKQLVAKRAAVLGSQFFN